MKRMQKNAPFFKKERTVHSMMCDAAIALAALLVLPVYYYGFRPLAMAGVSVFTAFLSQMVFALFRRKPDLAGDLAGLVTGLAVAVLLPVSAPLWLPAVASAFAMLVAKLPFGPTGRNPFNPAAAGVAFVIVCWPAMVFSYASPSTGKLPLFENFSAAVVQSPTGILKLGFKPDIFPLDLLWGAVAGPMGTVAILVVGAAWLYLLFRRTARVETTLCFLLVAALIAALSPRIACSALTSVKYELLSGSLFFGAVFLVSDPVTSPRTLFGRCLFGALAGALTMLFRYFGAYEQGVCFAVLLANAAAPILDRAVSGIHIRKSGLA